MGFPHNPPVSEKISSSQRRRCGAGGSRECLRYKVPLELSYFCVPGMMKSSSFGGAQQLYHQTQLKPKSLYFLEEKETTEVSAVRMGGVSLKELSH